MSHQEADRHTSSSAPASSGDPELSPRAVDHVLAPGSPFDATLPPTPLRTLFAADGASVIVYSDDVDLLATVQQARGGHYGIVAAHTRAKLEAAVGEAAGGVVVVDLAKLDTDIDTLLDRLARQAPCLVVLAAADRARAPQLIAPLSDQRVHRLLMKPAALGNTRLLLDSAVSRYLKLRQTTSSVRAAPRSPLDRFSPVRWPTWLQAGAVAALLVAVFLAVGLLRAPPRAPVSEAQMAAVPGAPAPAALAGAPEGGGEASVDGDSEVAPALRGEPSLAVPSLATAPGATTPDPDGDSAAPPALEVGPPLPGAEQADALEAAAPDTEAAASQAREVDELLASAVLRLQRGQLLAPRGDDARTYLDRVAAIDPEHPDLAGLRMQLASMIVGSARLVVEAGDLDTAQRLVTAARELGADAEVVRELTGLLSAARSRVEEQRQSELLALATARLEEGRLVEPAEDNAAHYLQSLRERNAEHAGLADAWDTLLTALSANAERAIAAADWTAAEAWLDELRNLDTDASPLATLDRELDAARRQAEYLLTPGAASELRLISAPPAEYPESALRSNIEGWVELEYVVGRDGVPRDVTVLRAEPPNRFDQAAVRAVTAYRYQPYELDGVVYERRVQLRVRFELL